MVTDPAHRHGGPDAGWYVPGPDGWHRIADAEVRDHGDAAHFMSNPNGRHAATVAGMTMRGGNGAPERVAPDGRTIIGGGGAGDSTTFGSVSAGGGASAAPEITMVTGYVQVPVNADGVPLSHGEPMVEVEPGQWMDADMYAMCRAAGLDHNFRPVDGPQPQP